jgi:hypothetical protein
MTIEFTKFTGKAPTIDAVLLTEDNIEELAAWLGADAYILEKTLKGGQRRVTFTSSRDRDGVRIHPRNIVRLLVGEYVVRYPDYVTVQASSRDAYYFGITQEDMDRFVKQQKELGEVEIAQPDPNAY